MIALVYILATVLKTHSIRLYFALFQFLPALMIPSSRMHDLGHSRSEGGGGGGGDRMGGVTDCEPGAVPEAIARYLA